MENIIVSKATPKDLKDIHTLGLNTPQLQIDTQAMYYSEETLARAINSPTEIFLVAKHNDKFVGHFLVHLNEVLEEVYISDISILPEYRGRGIGQMFMEKARELLKGKTVDWTWALVQEDNVNMHRFMEKQGFLKGKKFYFFYKPIGF